MVGKSSGQRLGLGRLLASFLAFALTAAALAAPAASAPGWRSSPALDAAASWLAMRDVSVRCQTPAESASDVHILLGASAYVPGYLDARGRWHPDDYTVFAHGLCETLDAIIADDATGYSLDDLAWAVLVLTHESGHLRGHRWSADEAKTECWAIRHVGYVAHRLGIVDEAARRLFVAQAVRIHRSLSAEYRLAGCRLPPSR